METANSLRGTEALPLLIYDILKVMKDKLLAALLDLRVALGELQASMIDVDKAIQKLMEVELDIKKDETERGKLEG